MQAAAGSPSSSTTTTTTIASIAAADPDDDSISGSNLGGSGGAPGATAIQSWWESISKARSRILSLASLLSSPDLALLADSDGPARSLLDSPAASAAISAALSAPSSGTGDDPLCHWLYDTFQSSDPDLRLVALSFLPLLSGLYLSRAINLPSLAGFEAVLLAVYAAEVKARGGKPVLVSVPDLSLPSLYHYPRQPTSSSSARTPPRPSVGVLSPPLEPQIAVKSTKRACIVAVALDSYYKNISSMPSRSKIDLCEFVAEWAGQDCPCRHEFDDDDENREIGGPAEEMQKLRIREGPNGNHCNGEEEGSRVLRRGSRVPLPWELLQPVLRILGHCLLAPLNPQEVRDSASMAVRCVYARASHDLMPQAILASHSLIKLDGSSRKVAKPKTTSANASKPNTPSKLKKPGVFLVPR
ncbi:Hyccin [Musa troglodytarum]|uniref:Hyccin n=1 Tax=Musa troglodytarum TaxID=320322 RepID=A0A9E7EP31_9LILI|nr:Hyccin [Musa troglodytarum]